LHGKALISSRHLVRLPSTSPLFPQDRRDLPVHTTPAFLQVLPELTIVYHLPLETLEAAPLITYFLIEALQIRFLQTIAELLIMKGNIDNEKKSW
jgi:hypothetical protein